MQLTDNVVAKSGIIEPISRLYINSTTSLITAQWTASNSSSECIEGYEVCWNRSSLIFTNTTCSNVSASTTSHSYSEQHENCIDYTATITTLGVNGLRSNPRFTSISISPLNVNDSTMIQSVNVVNVTGRNVVLSWEPVYDESPCASYYSVCHLEHNSRGQPNCLAVDKTRNNITLQLLKSYTRYNVNVSAVFPDQTQSDVVVTNFRTADVTPGVDQTADDGEIKWPRGLTHYSCVGVDYLRRGDRSSVPVR
uniref:Fibronectin type-III domain-containing protein n=1 Tax=Timema monikensis TaxID=170555 RepID=A0A7R9DXZ3_9NEOP|nr:unnamed protein product [Timema monikensis]